jgi:hypothetical protein
VDSQPADSFEVTFNLTPQDYRQVNRMFLLKQRRIMLALAGSVVAAVLVGLAGIPQLIWLFSGREFANPIRALLPLSCAAAWLLYPTYLLLLQPMLLGWQASKHRDMIGSITWNVDSARVTVILPQTTSEQNWSLFQKAQVIGPYYALIYAANRNAFLFIPKAALATPEQETQFRQYVEAALGPIK